MSALQLTERRFFDGLKEALDTFTARTLRSRPVEPVRAKRVTIVQFGDYAEAFRRFASGGSETYYAQRYAVDSLATLATKSDIESLCVICLVGNSPAEVLPNGVRTLSMELYPADRKPRYRELIEAVKATEPTHLIVMSPIPALILWGIFASIPVLPMFADSFRTNGLKARLKSGLLASLLNAPAIEIVANHNLAASLDLKRIGVDSDKIVPFDWPALISPQSYEAKLAPPADRPFRLIYVGSLVESKGVGDAIRAVAELRRRGRQVNLTIIGKGESRSFEQLVSTERLEKEVRFLGAKPHSEVLAAMRDHDTVVVPSHWSYPEGLPMTLYEGLCTRTPLLTSNHPMFALKIRHRDNALVFPERHPEALADCVEELLTTPGLYAELSAGGERAASGYLCPLKYHQLICGFLDPIERHELRAYSLARYSYT